MKTAKLLSIDFFQLFEYKFILLANKTSFGVWKLEFQDFNDRNSIDEILKEKDGFLKLMLN